MLIINTSRINVSPMTKYFKYVRKHRTSLNLTQAEYGLRYGVTQGLVSAVERGDRSPPKLMAIDVVSAFPALVSLGQLKPSFDGLTFEGGIVNTNNT